MGADGLLTMVGDLQRIARHHGLEARLQRVARRYALRAALDAAEQFMPGTQVMLIPPDASYSVNITLDLHRVQDQSILVSIEWTPWCNARCCSFRCGRPALHRAGSAQHLSGLERGQLLAEPPASAARPASLAG